MPSVSEKQHRAMEAAAHGHSTLGIPENVGKEFVNADSESTKAAGIVFIAGDKVLMTKRGNGGDHPNEWAFPGGHIEDGETSLQAAIRECEEELGHTAKGLTSFSKKADQYESFFSREEEFAPVLNHENSGYVWATLENLPYPMHPSVANLVQSDIFKQILEVPRTELDVARRIQSGLLPSGTHFGNMWLFNIRITGTGTAYRSKGDEFTYRPAEHYLNDEFLARCNGLQVIWQHPKKGTLNSNEFNRRTIGAIFLPYLKLEEEEVWGIAKIYDEEAAQEMAEHQLSTSPTVVGVGNNKVRIEDGTDVLIEGIPKLLDHVAICSLGVWDKGGDPSGVISDSVNLGVDKMTEEEKAVRAKADADEKEAKAKADSEKEEKQSKFMDSMSSFMDSMSKRMDAFEESTKPKDVVADKKKADEEEAKKKADDEEKEKADADEKARADAEETKKRIDAVESQMPKALSDDDYEAMADCQSRADSISSAFGETASRPQNGESVLGYKKRLAAKFKQHSPQFKDIDLASIKDDALFGIIEKQIYADALTAANNPVLAAGEGLREIKTRTAAGHTVSTFKGKIGSWMGSFKADAFKVTQLKTGEK